MLTLRVWWWRVRLPILWRLHRLQGRQWVGACEDCAVHPYTSTLPPH